jgi:hypothetical protein
MGAAMRIIKDSGSKIDIRGFQIVIFHLQSSFLGLFYPDP